VNVSEKTLLRSWHEVHKIRALRGIKAKVGEKASFKTTTGDRNNVFMQVRHSLEPLSTWFLFKETPY
jgi:hypothetical protein